MDGIHSARLGHPRFGHMLSARIPAYIQHDYAHILRTGPLTVYIQQLFSVEAVLLVLQISEREDHEARTNEALQ